MKAIELVGDVDERHRLNLQLPSEIPVGRVRVVVFPAAEDETGESWADGIAAEWSQELSDAREDLYTLEDGQPVNEAR